MIAAIERLIQLSKERPDSSFWDTNIIEAHELCTTELDYKHFWCYLTNPAEYNPALVADIRTIGDHIDEMSVDEIAKPVILPLPDYMEEIVHQNGNHITIEQRHKRMELDEDDEKNPPTEVM